MSDTEDDCFGVAGDGEDPSRVLFLANSPNPVPNSLDGDSEPFLLGINAPGGNGWRSLSPVSDRSLSGMR